MILLIFIRHFLHKNVPAYLRRKYALACFERTDSSRRGAVIGAGGRKVRHEGGLLKRMTQVTACPGEKEPQPSMLRAGEGRDMRMSKKHVTHASGQDPVFQSPAPSLPPHPTQWHEVAWLGEAAIPDIGGGPGCLAQGQGQVPIPRQSLWPHSVAMTGRSGRAWETQTHGGGGA